MTKFKIGDKVRNNAEPAFGLGKVLGFDGQEWAIVEHENQTKASHSGKGLGRVGYCWFTMTDSLELVEAAKPTPTTPKFEVNDTVLVDLSRGNRYGTNKLFDKRIATVVDVQPNAQTGDYAYRLKVADIDFTQTAHVDNITKVVLKSTDITQPEAKVPPAGDLKRGSQNYRILAHLMRGGEVSPLTAQSNFGAYRLAARIKELRDRGHKIKTEMRSDPVGRPYAVYTLRKAGRV